MINQRNRDVRWQSAPPFTISSRIAGGSRIEATHAQTVMDLIEYFERQKRRCERELEYSEAPGFQLCERTLHGQQDITAQHVQQLRESRDEYKRMIEYLKLQG
jgi:hypothetical protein